MKNFWRRWRTAGFASPLSAADFAVLQDIGVFRRDCRYINGRIENSEGQIAAATLQHAGWHGATCWRCAPGVS